MAALWNATRIGWLILGALVVLAPGSGWADGKLVKPRNYQGSLEEQAQEAIIIFQAGTQAGEAVEDLILKIRVTGEADEFAWVIPFPNVPKVEQEAPELFKELFDYVQARRVRSSSNGSKAEAKGEATAELDKGPDVEVISREVVGSFDVAVVKENTAGNLNDWLSENGYQSLDNAEDVLEFYREKNYVYACIRVSDTALGQSQGRAVDLHPLRFTFATGGQDGVYFPMKLTGLQEKPFDVNLYVFYRFWLNDRLNQFGYAHRHFQLYHRDWDTRECVANGGKAYSEPESDPYLKTYANRLEHTTKLMKKLYPGERFYLTNIQAGQLQPAEVREWKDDLWLFPYYTNRSFVPYDARPGGAASAGWPNIEVTEAGEDADAPAGLSLNPQTLWIIGGIIGGLIVGFVIAWILFRRQASLP